MARPKALTKAHKAEICARIVEGETVRQIGADEKLPSARTIYSALAADEAFSQQYARAREAQLLRWEDELLEIADDGTNDWIERRKVRMNGVNGPTEEEMEPAFNAEHVQRAKVRIDTRKWLMSKRAPKKYGDKLAVGGDEDAPPIRHSEIVVRIVDPAKR